MSPEVGEATLVVAASVVYALPSLLAVRDHTITEDHIAAIIVNAMAGWTIVGWFFALFLALHKQHEHYPATIEGNQRRAKPAAISRNPVNPMPTS
jgi:hypothetical protein